MEVRTASGERSTARDVIVTLPMNALSGIEFGPGLSALKQAAAAEGQASRGIKTWVKVRGEVELCYLLGGPAWH